mgnify:CR=1 FL=1
MQQAVKYIVPVLDLSIALHNFVRFHFAGAKLSRPGFQTMLYTGKFLTQREEIFEFAAERQEGKKGGRRRREKKGRVRKLQDGSLVL